MDGVAKWFEVIAGCMFSGKTEELIRRLERVRIAGRLVLLFKPTIDNRCGDKTTQTHYGREFPAFLLEPGKETLKELKCLAGKEALNKAAVVAFDEGQFFSGKLSVLCKRLIARDKRVIVAGLNQTFAGKPFGPMPALMALADEVVTLNAVCVKCGRRATLTQRLLNGEPAPLGGPEIQVGGAKAYEARCRTCWGR